jgi:ABC-type glutathione transport system ATPase component
MDALRIHLKAPAIRLPGRVVPDERLDLIVEPGRRTTLLGRSGAGKSLLARLALGRLPSAPVRTEGRVSLTVGDETVELDLARWPAGGQVEHLQALRGSRVSFVPQGGRENLVPGWTVRDHFRLLLGDDEGRFERAKDGMEALGLSSREENLQAVATELSEGMIRRVLIALAMAQGADVLLVDEPTTGLDPRSRDAFRELLDQRILASGAGVLLITHDIDLARDLGGEVVLVDEGAAVARAESLDVAGGPFVPFVRAHTGEAA